MRTPIHLRRRRGFSLVIVLGSLILMAGLVVVFLGRVTTELHASKTYAQGSYSRLLAQSALNVVVSQITAGTKGVAPDGGTLAWASQPGMIRTYDAAGAPRQYFKLYSSASLAGDGAFDPSGDAVPAKWYQQPALWTDLNQPVQINGASRYPILDGNSLTLKATGVDGTKGLTYDDGSGQAAVSGFYVSAATPTATGSGSNPVPMPVRWLYVLADGTLVSPKGTSSSLATIPGATAANPVVGRIAFWTDDETCKVNVNTASEGSSWDSPRVATKEDFNLALYQPARNEFQRYPGHPAGVALSSVFTGLSSDPKFPEDFYPVTPRVAAGGSKGGTVAPSASLSTRTSRLYATPEDLMFQPSLSGGTRATNAALLQGKAAAQWAPAALARSRFFVTAVSRAPDVNLFNLPRVSIWPVTLNASGTPTVTPFDVRAAFAATMRTDLKVPYRYYFERQNANDPNVDLPTASSTGGLGRNRMLLEYLRRLTSAQIPGFGGSFAAKYVASNPSGGGGIERDQILTEIFDYIRCTNLRDSTLWTGTSGAAATNWTGAYSQIIVPSTDTLNYSRLAGLGQVVPIEDTTTGTRGFGRFPTVAGAYLQFIGVANSATTGVTPAVAAGNLRIQAGFFLQMFDPSQGVPTNRPWFGVKVSGLGSFQWNGNAMGFPAAGDVGYPMHTNASLSSLAYYGGAVDPRIFFYGRGAATATQYPLVSGTIDLPISTGSFPFQGGDVTVEVYSLDASGNSSTVQTVTMNFPAATFPLPSAVAPSSITPTGSTTAYDFRSFYDVVSGSATTKGRFSADSPLLPVSKTDVVRSVVPAAGDPRLIAAMKKAPASLFTSFASYSDKTMPFAFNARAGIGYPFYGSSMGGLVSSVSYPGTTAFAGTYYKQNDPAITATGGLYFIIPKDPQVLSQASVTQTGGVAADWDNGLANLSDGPYINKPDEGDVGNTTYKPYFQLDYTGTWTLPGSTYFSPNRIVPSAAMFGSLPTGVFGGKAWQTLLFRPGPANHPGLGVPVAGPPYTVPPDHLLLDLFTMPVVEPYPISDHLSTAGRVNMNYQIVPFTYVNRDTAVRAALKAQKLLAIPSTAAQTYKYPGVMGGGGPTNASQYRMTLNADATLLQFLARFGAGDLFRSASEICSVDLVPSDGPSNPTRASMDAYWSARALTGDNSRERPYANLYPLLTTKSNTFTVYVRVQALKKAGNSDPTVWREGTDLVTDEYRGSTVVERYVDPNDSSLPDFADTSTNTPLSRFYKIRLYNPKSFSP
ncbi:Verru_Chthon cassette protein A [Verrucomicrobium sp. GAS474]|uniref:Verru_Chthon cassette protein A n=1 Tax=Verrucomicrobium sp. GAS474 TaxID=1882831 RepID=UPI00087A0701|nr:Verru_Chthon cassette protein A [Verrucomicrobium sp. GAS474]SDU05989.1 Verru_Chthon cassette protein A [Verrucomicrobium sp. GAS474]